jgi:hypothetical protein
LEENVAAPVYKTENTAVGIRHADQVEPLYPQKLALTLSTSGGRSVGIVRSLTQATEFSLVLHCSDKNRTSCLLNCEYASSRRQTHCLVHIVKYIFPFQNLIRNSGGNSNSRMSLIFERSVVLLSEVWVPCLETDGTQVLPT